MVLRGARAWVYTSGEVTGRLPFAPCVTVLTWNGAPGVARREAAGRRLFGLRDWARRRRTRSACADKEIDRSYILGANGLSDIRGG
jgi:hypothetical protein